jgi:two-component system cell cycle response regulator DivK
MSSSRPLILLVDDFDDALEIYSTYLTFHGYDVMTAGNGAEALAAARAHAPALVLMDLRMPVMDGTAALREMRATPQLARIPVVALTAHALETERLAALAAGFDAVISKPCLPPDLLLAVQKVIGPATAGE